MTALLDVAGGVATVLDAPRPCPRCGQQRTEWVMRGGRTVCFFCDAARPRTAPRLVADSADADEPRYCIGCGATDGVAPCICEPADAADYRLDAELRRASR